MDKNLEAILEDSNAGFEISGRKIKYFSLYEGLKKYLMPKHEETTKGAIITSIKSQIDELKKADNEDEIINL